MGLEDFGKILADDENHARETGANSVEDRVVENGFAIRTHRVHLLETAVAGAHTSGKDEECG